MGGFLDRETRRSCCACGYLREGDVFVDSVGSYLVVDCVDFNMIHYTECMDRKVHSVDTSVGIVLRHYCTVIPAGSKTDPFTYYLNEDVGDRLDWTDVRDPNPEVESG